MASPINRRVFLKQSAAVSAAALAGCSVGAGFKRETVILPPPRRGPNEELRVAIIGFRGRGNAHIVGHAKGKNVRIATLCDIDERLFGNGLKKVAEVAPDNPAPKTEFDLRRVMEDKSIDCVSISTPNHWHSLAAIWACQAGKDVYCEKPCSHNIFEGRKLVEAAAKYQRAVQHGTQNRSRPVIQKAMQLLHEGVIGDVYMARGVCYRPRNSIGIKQDCPVPEGVHYDLWQGPAPKRPFNPNRFHYEWHWNWAYGNGEIGNQGVHQMDIGIWGLGKDHTLPVKISSMGGRFTYEDQGQTANTQVANFQYDDGKMMVFEVRGRPTNYEWDVRVGNLFYGSKGYMAIRGRSFETVVDGKPGPTGNHDGIENIFTNFHEVVRNRKLEDLVAPIEVGHYASAHCHLANASYRLGRSLAFDPAKEKAVGDAAANAMLTRKYRAPYVVPNRV